MDTSGEIGNRLIYMSFMLGHQRVSGLQTSPDKLLNVHSVTMSAIANSIHYSLWPT